MDDDQVQTLFQQVLLDREFAKAVTRDPVSAFATLGIVLDPKDVPAEGVKLPAKREIFRAWDASVGDCRMPRSVIRIFMPSCEKHRD